MSQALITAKPFKSYQKQLSILQSRGMIITDIHQALKKLEEISYYRLSGFWYVFRKVAADSNGNVIQQPYNQNVPKRLDDFYPNTTFSNVLDLYLFDKNLRLLMLDALERIEIYIRSIIAYEMGKSNPMAYEDDQYIDAKFLIVNPKTQKSRWDQWKDDNNSHIDRSHEDCIRWHVVSGKQMPIWVVTEAWDFGLMSRYFSMLKGKYKNKICSRIDQNLTPNVLNNWLVELNTLRNRCAHHTRIWNQVANNPILMPNIPYFQGINLSADSRARIHGTIAVIWFMVHKIGSSSTWIDKIGQLLRDQSQKAYFRAEAMGFSKALTSELLLLKQSVI